MGVQVIENIILHFVIFYFVAEMSLLVFVHTMYLPFWFVGIFIYTFQISLDKITLLLKRYFGKSEVGS